MEEDGTKKKGGIELDWDILLLPETASVPEEEPPQLVVVPGSMPGVAATMAVDSNECESDDLRKLSDKDLIAAVERFKRHLKTLKLKDGGQKMMCTLKRYEDERERRQRLCLQKDDDRCKNIILNNPKCMDTSDSCREGETPSRLSSPSKFAARFFNKLDEKRTESRTGPAFGKEISTLNHCEQLKMTSTGPFKSRDRQKSELSSRETPFQSPGNLSGVIHEKRASYHNQNGRWFSACSPRFSDGNLSGSFAKRRRFSRGQISTFGRHKNQLHGEHVVLDDEEELEAKGVATQESTIGESINGRIYYPSRDDSEAVEILYSDMDCLAPEQYLSSTIMNFYIRYLQGLISPPDTECSYHFFNTYFYEKLKEAVTRKNTEETSFAKFRRWWKGVNIFEKAYVFLPIHESLHWSLVIICIPDKEDESGPILLHLDSLGLHFSKPIFSNIKRFLIEEWKILKEDGPVDLPIADRVWERLPRRMDEKVVEVPQQKNDYDCGLFVLFFMKKFIDESPKRLRRKDFPTFGRRWFNPEEASSLRKDIRRLLKENFDKSLEHENLDP